MPINNNNYYYCPAHKLLQLIVSEPYLQSLSLLKETCFAYSCFILQLQVDNGHPKDLDSISAKVKEKKYITVVCMFFMYREILN